MKYQQNKRIVAVIKASSISNYFPNRFDTTIGGCGLLPYIVNRIRISKLVNDIALATTNDSQDDPLAESARALGVEAFRGEYNDALGRLYGAAKKANADVVVKVFGNYPFVEPYEMDRLLRTFLASKCSYAYNEHPNGIPLGLGVEAFSFDLLEKTNQEVDSDLKRRFGSKLFHDILPKESILQVNFSAPRPEYRVSLAVSDDTVIAERIYEKCPKADAMQIVRFLDENPIINKYAERNIAGPQEVGLEKLMIFPEKVMAIQTGLSKGIDLSYPLSVELSLTNRCNLACEWCSDQDLRDRAMGDIDFGILKQLFTDLAKNGTRGVVIEGGGEPTLYNQFAEAVDYAKKLGLKLGLITNGLNVPYIDKVDCFDWIRVSLDAANQEQFAKLKGRDGFDRVIQNIQKISEQKEICGNVLGVGYVLTNENFEDLENLIIKLKKINVSYIQIRPVIDHPNMQLASKSYNYLQKHSTFKFAVHTHNMEENVVRGNMGLPCRTHSLSTVITANGDVFICGRLNKYEWLKPIGNLYKESFHDIWHGEERHHQAGKIMGSGFCQKWCPECRLTKYNVLFENMQKIKTKNFI
jgi:MoaA/NifB/PqqE/SkfB family radical SAM enzyme/spore coat polysaccharide biosynthesis protein SpsF (cytidylyltransferase family)